MQLRILAYPLDLFIFQQFWCLFSSGKFKKNSYFLQIFEILLAILAAKIALNIAKNVFISSAKMNDIFKILKIWSTRGGFAAAPRGALSVWLQNDLKIFHTEMFPLRLAARLLQNFFIHADCNNSIKKLRIISKNN